MKYFKNFLLLLLVMCTFSASAQANLKPEAYVDLDGIWKTTSIPVCWEGGAADKKVEKGWVEQAVYNHIEGLNQDVSGVRLVNDAGQRFNWTTCSSSSRGIRIKVSDERPWSYVGQQWIRLQNGEFKLDSKGQKISKPTNMALNFTFAKTFGFCLNTREHCIKAIAVHEFMHALGFLHEQLRPDAPKECKEKFSHESDFAGFRPVEATVDYDADSHMNYCANMYRVPIALSAGDLQALRKYYPLK